MTSPVRPRAIQAAAFAVAAVLVAPASCGWPDQEDVRRPVAEVRIVVPGPEEGEAALREILERWRALYPRAPLPDLRVEVNGLHEGEDAAYPASAEGELLVPVEGVTPEDAARAAAPGAARALVRAAQEQAPRRPFLLTLVSGGPSLLDRAVQEGAADLLAHVLAGRHPHPVLLEWGRKREGALWRAFQEVMGDGDAPGWFDPVLESEREDDDEELEPPPGDPARFLGYRIAEAYWARTGDRAGAARDLVLLADPTELANRSLYAGRGAGPEAPPSLRGLPLATWPGFECGHFRQGSATLFGCAGGSGPVTVALDAGEEADHRSWHRVAQELAQRARVVVYDRAGVGDSEAGTSVRLPLQGVHELAGLLEVLGGVGPYVLAGHGRDSGHLRAFALLYPWRTGGLLFLGSEGSSSPAPAGRVLPPIELRTEPTARGHLEDPARIVAALLEMADQLAVPGEAASPGAAGEPRGCWRAQGTARTDVDGRTFRLAHTPAGGEDLLEGSHPVFAVDEGPGVGGGRWYPLGRSRIQVAIGLSDAGGFSAELTQSGEMWRGGSATLRPHPCELPE